MEARREREIEWAAVKSEFAAAEAVLLDAVRAATERTPQEVVAQVAHTVQGMARLGKDMADVVHKLMKVPKGGAEVARLREEFAEVKLEVAK